MRNTTPTLKLTYKSLPSNGGHGPCVLPWIVQSGVSNVSKYDLDVLRWFEELRLKMFLIQYAISTWGGGNLDVPEAESGCPVCAVGVILYWRKSQPTTQGYYTNYWDVTCINPVTGFNPNLTNSKTSRPINNLNVYIWKCSVEEVFRNSCILFIELICTEGVHGIVCTVTSIGFKNIQNPVL